MKKLQRALVLGVVATVAIISVSESNYIQGRQDEVYSSLKDKYVITEEVKIEEEKPQETIQEEVVPQVEQPVVEEVSKVEETKAPENRTTENIIWDYLRANGYSEIQTAAIIR